MSAEASIAVVVLNWRNAPDTLECLQSLSTSSVPADVIVVDNDSRDGSADLIEQSGLAAQVIRNDRNAGYAGGNNAGLHAALDQGYDVIGVLNNDTTVRPEAVGQLVQACLRLPGPAACSPRIDYSGQPGVPWFAGGVIDKGLPRHLQPPELEGSSGVGDTETLSGCCIFATSDVWRRVGLFDESYFLIFEDSDWSARARARGVRLVVDHDSLIHHKVSRSFAGGPMSLISTYFYIRNGLRFHWRHQRRSMHHFIWTYVVRGLLRRVDGLPYRQLFVLWGVADCLCRRGGNASARTWRMAESAFAGKPS